MPFRSSLSLWFLFLPAYCVGRVGFPKEQKPLLYPSVTVFFPFLYGYLPFKREISLPSESKT